ncbi:autotransporter outer membrane beta-barrel domain-containing protein [Achromobacter aegrifaciens]|uniref:Autotransporter outer membrane beta-barrel domain-containing protein n=1 Tax=Achromobacter aegrifaciens TaxID=1287736 RepID=A0ABU2DJK3_ACHAE|nr:autotransporter outer membrane beta-barrel domain-containing protein [Achromobacter aegrifaciens]MDR7948299.1 autotransporter outer membrane beta-barrel domain-containing protein [Achromobacter aegrifaciens]
MIDPTGALVDKNALLFGPQSTSIAVYDPITGGQRTVAVMDSRSFAERPGGSTSSINVVEGVGENQFVDLRLGTVASTGGTLNISVSGNMNSFAKQTDLVFADGTGAAPSTATWNSTNSIDMGLIAPLVIPAPVSVTTQAYVGTFTAFDGSTHTVTTLAGLQAYNNWLIQRMKTYVSGDPTWTNARYVTELHRAYVDEVTTLEPGAAGNPPATDKTWLTVGNRSVMRADGANATVRVTSTGFITARVLSTSEVSATAPYANWGDGSVLRASNGGTAINDGMISQVGFGQTMIADSGGVAINNGTLHAGYAVTSTKDGIASPTVTGGRAVYVSDSRSRFVNNGIINIGSWTASTTGAQSNTGVLAVNGGNAVNNGAINAGVNDDYNGAVYGVNVGQPSTSGSFTNAQSGVIYLGRGPGFDASKSPDQAGGTDVNLTVPGYGVYVGPSAGSVVVNDGRVVLGTLTQGGTGLFINARSVANVTNNGIIDVNAARSGTPLSSYGVQVQNSTGVINSASSRINLNGVNGVGIFSLSNTSALNTAVDAAGTINILAGADPSTGLRNYGIWSQGAKSRVTLTGAVNMAGDGAIGVHARDGGNVVIAGNGAINFQGGKNQIGYLVFGPSSSIINTGTGAQNVSTEGSTLFRMEDGADFAGGAGATSTLTAAGKNSTAVLVTGATGSDVSAFNSGGMTINLTGEDAIGVRVQGGAQGKIATNAVIKLLGAGAIAGVADGQKYGLDGSAVGAPVMGVLTNATHDAGAAGFGTGTLLIAGADLSSSLTDVVGYVARNGASLSNSGNIVFTGANTTGIRVEEGSTGGNSGSITVQDGGVGLVASSSAAATTLNNTGSLVLKGGGNAGRTLGVSAQGSAVTVNMTAGQIDMQGQGAIGAAARSGATVNLTGSATPKFSSDPLVSDQIAFLIAGNGSTINTDTPTGTVLDASGRRSTLFRLEAGATQSGVLKMRASGEEARGVWATGAGTSVVAMSGSTFDVSGNGAQAVLVQGGANATLGPGTNITQSGINTLVGTVDGNEYALDGTTVVARNTGSRLASEATVNASTANSTGFVTQNAGTLINKGDITYTGANSKAVKVIGGTFENVAGSVTANGVAVYVEGAGAKVDVTNGLIKAVDGEAAIKLGQNASLDLVGSGLGTVTASGTAHGVLVGTGAAGLVVDGAWIDMASVGAGSGNGIENQAELAGIQLTSTTVIEVMDGKGVRTGATLAQANAGMINVWGSGTGLAFESAAGGAMGNNIDLSASSGLDINLMGAGGTGISVKHTGAGDVKTAANVTIGAGGGAALALDGVASVTNSGRLASASSVALVALGNAVSFVNTAAGELFGSNTATVMAFDGQDSMLTNAGLISGRVDMGSGDNRVLLEAGSSAEQIVSGAGSDLFTVKGDAAFTQMDGGMGPGEDTVVFENTTRTLPSASALAHFENLYLRDATTLSTGSLIAMTDTGSGVGHIDIDASSTLVLAPATGGYTLNHALSGSGLISAEMGAAADAFNFGADTGTAFVGALAAGRGTLALGGANTRALTNATLKVGAGNVTTVGDGSQAIGGMVFDGGTVVFDAKVPDQMVASSLIETRQLDVRGSGAARILLPSTYVPSAPNTPNTLNLLAQDDANIGVQLVNAASTVGTAGALVLQDQSGAAVTSARELDIEQNGSVVAKGTYDFRLSTAPGDGLYVNYGLSQLDLQEGQSLTLVQDSGASGAAADMSARIIGAGNLIVGAGTAVVSISNSTNSYAGGTTVASGTLRLDADSALGQTSGLRISTNAVADINGKTQVIGELAGQNGSTLNLRDGALTIANGGSSAGALTGAGSLILAGGTLAVQGANAGLSAATTIASGAAAVLNDAAGLGAGAINNAGTLKLERATGTLTNAVSGVGLVALSDGAQVSASGENAGFSGMFSTDAGTALTVSKAANLGSAEVANAGALVADTGSNWTLGNTVSGAGDFIKRGAGVLTAGEAMSYTGKTSVEAGTLVVGDAAHPGAVLGGSGADTVSVSAGAALGGQGTVNGQVVNFGTVAALNALPGLSEQTASTLTLAKGLTNHGDVNLAGGSVGNRLVVKGDYVGVGGTVTLAAFKGDDSSATDKLVLDGGQASGDTGLVIKHAGGNGAQTTQGIRLVETQNGASTTAGAFRLDARSDGYRQGAGSIAAGAFDYRLARGGNGGNAQDWYLVSRAEDVPPTPPTPPNPPTPPGPGPQPDPEPTPPVYRPEVGAYMNNKLAATTMQHHTLRDRQGQASGEHGKPEASSWLRVAGGQNRRDGAGSTKDRSTDYLIQGGSDVLRFNIGEEGSMRLGAMASYGNNSSKARSDGMTASGKVEGYNVGIYGTWYGNADILSGPYVDSWAMLGRQDNTVSGEGLANETYRSRTKSASIEAGYSFKVYENAGRKLYVQPQAQAIVTRYTADDHVEKTGTKISGQAQTSVTTRVGVRLQGQLDDDKGLTQMRPFAEVNWWKGPSSQHVSFDGESVRENLPANRIELKAGLQGNVSKSVSVYGSLGLEAGSSAYSAARGQIGVKYMW